MSDGVTAQLDQLRAQRADIAAALLEPIDTCVRRHDTDHTVFSGCIDWHSSVHGFWALAAAARTAGRSDLGDVVMARLSAEGITAERHMLNRRQRFEMPYGRAWFLRLAIEFERAFDDPRLRPMADDVATSLVNHFSAAPVDPASVSYSSASWALLNLRAFGRHTGRGELVEFVDTIVASRFVPIDAPCRAGSDHARRSFMAGCTNWAWLVSETLDQDEFNAWLARFMPDPSALHPVERPGNAHLYGLDFSRAWGLWRIYRASGDRRYLELYLDHFTTAYAHPDWWRGDYEIVGHWVAQFGMFALMPLFDPDYF